MIQGIVGVIVWTDDLDRMLAFYCDVLGLRPHSVRPGFVTFKWGNMRLSVGVHSKVKGRTQEPHRVMVNFGVDDIQSVYKTFSSKGIEFMRPPEKEHWGGWVSTFQDPDSNVLQLIQQPPG